MVVWVPRLGPVTATLSPSDKHFVFMRPLHAGFCACGRICESAGRRSRHRTCAHPAVSAGTVDVGASVSANTCGTTQSRRGLHHHHHHQPNPPVAEVGSQWAANIHRPAESSIARCRGGALGGSRSHRGPRTIGGSSSVFSDGDWPSPANRAAAPSITRPPLCQLGQSQRPVAKSSSCAGRACRDRRD